MRVMRWGSTLLCALLSSCVTFNESHGESFGPKITTSGEGVVDSLLIDKEGNYISSLEVQKKHCIWLHGSGAPRS